MSEIKGRNEQRYVRLDEPRSTREGPADVLIVNEILADDVDGAERTMHREEIAVSRGRVQMVKDAMQAQIDQKRDEVQVLRDRLRAFRIQLGEIEPDPPLPPAPDPGPGPRP